MQQNEPILTTIGEFYLRYYKDAITKLSISYPDNQSLFIDFLTIDVFNPDIAERLLEAPNEILPFFTQALRAIDLSSGVVLEKTYPRIINLPRKTKIRYVSNKDIDTLISIEGVVTKATEVRPRMVEAEFECPFCHHTFFVKQEGRNFKEPTECETESGGCGRKVPRFKLLPNKEGMVKSQKLRLQEAHEDLRGGEMPETIDISVEEDLTGKVVPGNRVIVTGILRAYQRITQKGKTPFFDIYLDANSIEVKEEAAEDLEISAEDIKTINELKNQPDIYENLLNSIAPSIYGYKEVKEAILLQLFGGVSFSLTDGTRRRGDIHIILVGDPGLAKSDLLLFSQRVALRGMYSDGTGASGAGLTAAAVKDAEFGGNSWTLDAGTLVLADKGIAAVDEMEKMDKEDREKIHGALEQQFVSISKAGINAKLNSRCALLAAANPKMGRFGKYVPLSEQINLPPSLLSRFDLIFPIMDKPNETEDSSIAKHILNSYDAIGDGNNGDNTLSAPIPIEVMRKYIATAKRINPVLTDAAKAKFENFYIGLRKQNYGDETNPVSITARQLQALVRLGQARARARLSNTVTIEDAASVINLVMYCLKNVFTDPETGKLDLDWVHVGVSSSERDRAMKVRKVIRDLEKEYGAEVPVDEIYELAENEGVEREKAEHMIDLLKRDGILFSPSRGVVRFVR